MKFSERIGAVRRLLQKDSMDDALKNALWNITYRRFWESYAYEHHQQASGVREGTLLLSIWADHFDQFSDEARPMIPDLIKQVKKRYIESNWLEVYDFVEFVVNYRRSADENKMFIADCNLVLEKHVSAYRFVGMTLAPITSEEEITAVEQAMSHGDQFRSVVSHLETAIARLADRESPDYRNSIKESISAVEAVCEIITGEKKVTLGQALKKIGVHPALEKGFSAIYGYTSDAGGIRHALSDDSIVDADDAKFFLVSCSAFVNYLIAKSSVHSTNSD
jgi:uncharacterized protein with PIN domain